jgi:hypothetical protein
MRGLGELLYYLFVFFSFYADVRGMRGLRERIYRVVVYIFFIFLLLFSRVRCGCGLVEYLFWVDIIIMMIPTITKK